MNEKKPILTKEEKQRLIKEKNKSLTKIVKK